MRKQTKRPLAVLCSDLHLSLTPPVARSKERNWLAVQGRYLRNLALQAMTLGKVPIICAGDVFHKWNSPPELINFALDELPENFYSIPGQHDLPLHRMDNIGKSAYWTCVKAGKIHNLSGISILETNPKSSTCIQVAAFPWGTPLEPQKNVTGLISLAVVHAYCWTGRHCYKGADSSTLLGSAWKDRLDGYDAALFGDNHKGFLASCNGCTVLNHGAFQCRNLDERGYSPHLGVLLSDGTIDLIPVDTSGDKWLIPDHIQLIEDDAFTAEAFISELRQLGTSEPIDFNSALRAYMKTHKLSGGAQEVILQAYDSCTTTV